MTKFLKGNQLNSKLDEIIENAQTHLYLISPFIKFHARIKEVLNLKMDDHQLQIVVVFGKNKEKRDKSMTKEDFDYLCKFPNIVIKYEERLHAKYYANGSSTLLSSMNLYEFSQNNNIEFGIYFEANGTLDNLIGKDNIDGDAWEYFRGVIENAETIYQKTPQTEKGFLGLTEKYINSNVVIDNSSSIFGRIANKSKPAIKSIVKIPSKQMSKLLSGTGLGKLMDEPVPYKEVVKVMSVNGFIKEGKITAKGIKQGLEYNTNDKGDSWIVYPESLKEIL